MQIKSVMPGNYASNYLSAMAPRKQDDGSFILSLPLPGETLLPTVDMGHDYGRYVLAAAQDGSPDQILAGGHYISLDETVKVMSQCESASFPHSRSI